LTKTLGEEQDKERSKSKPRRDKEKESRLPARQRSPSGSPVTPPPCTTAWRGPLLKSGVLLAELEGTVLAPDGVVPALDWPVPTDLHVTMYSGGSNMEQQIKAKVNLKAQELWDSKLLVLSLPAGSPPPAVTGFAKLIASLQSKGKAAVVKVDEHQLWLVPPCRTITLVRPPHQPTPPPYPEPYDPPRTRLAIRTLRPIEQCVRCTTACREISAVAPLPQWRRA
jgi:hypothetical protein